VGSRGIVTIDGPAGAGKSTVARLLAHSLGYLYLDSGALYRAVAWQAQQLGLDLDRDETLEEFLADFAPELTADSRGFHLVIDGVEVSEGLRSPMVTRESSRLATQPLVRRVGQRPAAPSGGKRRGGNRRPGSGHRGLPRGHP
jgi:cytidylate kinase